jgi:Putative endonuclease segE, GIY-YIG domain
MHDESIVGCLEKLMWFYEGKEVDENIGEGYVGFVYIIENTLTNKKYIGKKLFQFTRTKKIAGKKKKVKSTSDWQIYYGSNGKLLEDVKELGEQHFKRTILKLCKSKGTANYHEAKYQMYFEVLESSEFYNDQIRVRVHRSHRKD